MWSAQWHICQMVNKSIGLPLGTGVTGISLNDANCSIESNQWRNKISSCIVWSWVLGLMCEGGRYWAAHITAISMDMAFLFRVSIGKTSRKRPIMKKGANHHDAIKDQIMESRQGPLDSDWNILLHSKQERSGGANHASKPHSAAQDRLWKSDSVAPARICMLLTEATMPCGL